MSHPGPKLLQQRALAQVLIEHGWIDANQSNSAHAMAEAIYRLRPVPVEDHKVVVEILDIVLEYNADPHDTDLAGSAIALLDLLKRYCPEDLP